ncbi:DNA replication ATP-dependent helicase/nuclease DNA2 [Pseudocercospora fuligena]|uniref:DNA replication ATP-dependent helicase/nuclease n=1 Tax=Pseudocercospora fuligena TaxID=685502 RepID=A0A8H6VLK4_9PEZI|nr:DNA replication ATP-dependent helicase/nuclease DNA2 [Pseudocercospora fuligena]
MPRPGQWNRYHHGRQPLHDTPTNVPVKPAIPATSEAKSKLQAFQFVGGGEQATTKTSEETSATENGKGDNMAMEKPHSEGGSSHQTPSIPHANTFPCTPGARLPLEELIGNVDEVKEEEPVKRSPQEQIGWIPNSSSDLLTPNRRKRRRAKSSSPTCPGSSSQPNQNSTQKDATSAFKTPAADPAADLWQKYANGRQTGDTLKLPEISSLIFQASPRPLETPVKDGKLRRWASTGNDWPTSKNKRRCTNSRASIAIWQDQTAIESGGKSKVATMVQKMQETLASQRLEQTHKDTPTALSGTDAPSSSSPLPDAGANSGLSGPKTANTSPLQTRRPAVPAQASRPPAIAFDQAQSKPRPQMQRTQSGGVRYDPSRVIGDPLNPGAAPTYALQSKAPLPAYKRPSVTKAPSQPKVPQAQVAPVSAVTKNGHDEFEDDDFDLTADDLDELCSQVPLHKRSLHDIPPHPNPPPQSQTIIADALSKPAEQHTTILIEDDDEFGGDEIDEDSFAQAEVSATQALRRSPRKHSPRKSPRKSRSTQSSFRNQNANAASRVRRYVVTDVQIGSYTNSKGRQCEQKILRVEDGRTRASGIIILRDSWFDTAVSKRTIVNIASLKRHRSITPITTSALVAETIIDDTEQSNFLILHPDHMLSATTVADSFDCVRKAVLQDRIKATGETNKSMVYGKILHEIFQQCLSADRWDQSFLNDMVERTVQAQVEGLWELGMRDNVLAIEEVKAKMGELEAWSKVFVKSEPAAESTVDDRQGEKVLMSISKLIAIEEHVWSPRYGLKGNIDATVQATTTSRPGAPDLKNLIVPFEVKTGRTTQSASHRAQTALYTLLLSDRYDVEVEAGILYYLESSSMSRIAPPFNEVKQMVQQRNRLASYIFRARHPPEANAAGHDTEPPVASQAIQESGLPALLRNPFKCGRCYAQESCFSYHALVESGTSESAGMIDDKKKNHSMTWKEVIGHLQLESRSGNSLERAEMLKRWFTKWDKLLTFEERDQSKLRKELWTMASSERESAGRCFGNLVIKEDLTSPRVASQAAVDDIEGSGGKINRYAYSLKRAPDTQGGSFTEGSQLTVGEPVVVSSEEGQWALANGYVTKVSRSQITVAVDRKLGDARTREADFDDKTNQAFRGMNKAREHRDDGQQDMRYRLDKDEFSNGLAMVRNNLVRLMSAHPIHEKLREQIIFGMKPTFAPTPPCQQDTARPTQLGTMNEDQQHAVERVLAAEDYALILGMPGTGKTTTIAHIIRALLAEHKSILLTSFTHTAVDNILLKIRGIVPEGSVLRLGVPAKINDQVQEFVQLAAKPRGTIEEVDDAFMGTSIVATTCMGTNHALFNRRSFDVCIVDEASQITLPTILGPLLHARKFVLVGDHYQLPPLVQNRAALEGGLDVSLFRQLSEAQPDAVVDLGRQYRMCEDIMTLSNELIYHGRLRCGNDAVASRILQADDVETLERLHDEHAPCYTMPSTCWLNRVTEPYHRVVFANTSQLGKSALETLSGGGKITNNLEATLVAQTVLALIARGVPGSEIGVITLYRSQLALMRQLFRRANIPDSVEIDSADRFQGRDKECIIISMVRSNAVRIVGDLLKDWRRVNVALTRGRSKLVVFGNRETLKHNELLDKMLNMMDERHWTFDLPTNADGVHRFNFSTQDAEHIAEKQSPSPKKTTKASPSKLSPTKRGSPSKQGGSPVKKIAYASSPSKLGRSPLRPSSGNVRSPMKSGKGLKKPSKHIRGSKKEKLNADQAQIFMDLTTDD